MKPTTAIKRDIQEYIGIYTDPVSNLGTILKALVDKYSSEIYYDDAGLQSALHELGSTPSDIHKVCLMTKVSGFQNLIECDLRTQQNDLDRYMKNAVDETGFNRLTVLKLTADIALSVGIAFECSLQKFSLKSFPTEASFVVPASFYESEIKEFKEEFEKSAFRDNDVTKLDFSKLQPLVAAGIPKAKFYLGYCLLHGIEFDVDYERAIKLLQEAADDGDTQAAATLGDYYYENGVQDWGLAYDYYTGLGSLALNADRKDAIVNILNQKRYNRSILVLSFVLFLVMVITIILAPGIPLYGAHRVIGSIFALISFAVLVVTCLHHRARPYDVLYYAPTGVFIMWFLYMLIRLLF